MSAVNIALKFAGLLFGVSILFILFKRVKSLKKHGLSGLLYVLSLAVTIALFTFIFFLSNGETNNLIIGQLLILAVGILHVLFSKNIVPWFREQPFYIQLILFLCLLLFAQFFSGLSFSYLVFFSLPVVWYFSLLWFVVPTLLNLSIIRLMEVPRKIFKTWRYPINANIPDPTDKELKNPLVISFVFRKSDSNSNYTTFRAKAPVGMSLGRLFYFFINDYNLRHPESKIDFLDDNNEPMEWTFFKLKNKILNIKEALDPEESIYSNEIKEDNMLVCKRLNTEHHETTK
jgi:hypothetical protein